MHYFLPCYIVYIMGLILGTIGILYVVVVDWFIKFNLHEIYSIVYNYCQIILRLINISSFSVIVAFEKK